MIDQEDCGIALVETNIGLAHGVTPFISAENPARQFLFKDLLGLHIAPGQRLAGGEGAGVTLGPLGPRGMGAEVMTGSLDSVAIFTSAAVRSRNPGSGESILRGECGFGGEIYFQGDSEIMARRENL